MSSESENPLELIARSAKLLRYVMLRRTLQSDRLYPNLGAHLRWMVDAEKAGHIVLSGPVKPHDGPTQLDGLTIIRAENLAAAQALARSDPLVAGGIVSFELCEWTINEGSIAVTVTISDSTVTFG